jgi:hypothetical protein
MWAMEPRVKKVARRSATRMAAGTAIQSLRKTFIFQPYMLWTQLQRVPAEVDADARRLLTASSEAAFES